MKVLIVDDDAGNRRLATRMLQRTPSMIVEQAEDGRSCLALAAADRFDVVLLDISMPEMDGMEVCRRLRLMPHYAGVPIVACTAHAGSRDRDEFLRQGFTRVLTKPFLLDELLGAIDLGGD
jgi:CheY-like chemotaxis protein